MTVQAAIALGYVLGSLTSPLLVLLVVITMKRTRRHEDPWL
jgi:hypothetical protein